MNTFTGCLTDNRPQYEIEKDYQADELFAFGGVNWEERKPTAYPVRNQAQSSSCVAQSLALMLSILNYKEEGRWVEFSASDIYQRRQNKGYGGMMLNDALEIVRKYGSTLEVLMPSQNMSEAEINKVKREISDGIIAKIFTPERYFQAPFDIEKIAATVQSGLPVMTWFRFPRAEWTAEPKVTSSKEDMVHHSVVAIDCVLRKGKKYLVIQDSWGHHSSTDGGLRYISEDYIKNRMTAAAFFVDRPNSLDLTPKPQVKLTKTLRGGSKDPQVVDLQKVLVYEEFLPRQTNSTDGIFGPATEAAVKELQRKLRIGVDGIVGPETRSFINSLYA